jgi:hypothetical protein
MQKVNVSIKEGNARKSSSALSASDILPRWNQTNPTHD